MSLTLIHADSYVNASDFRLVSANNYSGYTRGGEVKRHKIKIPAGYSMSFNFHTPTYGGMSETMFKYAATPISDFTEAVRFRFTNIAPATANDVNFQLATHCNYPRYLYLEFSGYSVGGHYNHFDYNVQFYSQSSCGGSPQEPVKPKPEDTLPKLHVDGKSISSRVTKGEFKKYKLQGQRSGKVDIVIDNLSDDVDLYVRKNGMVGKKKRYYNCRPYYGGTRSEVCTIDYVKGKTVTIGVSGYRAGSYRLQAYYNELMDIPVSAELSGEVRSKTWRHYIVKNHQAGQNLIAQIKNLSADVDLYVNKDSQPTSSSYDCRPYTGGTRDEMCKIKVNSSNEKIYISVHGYRAGSYKLSLKKAPKKRATILLHGLASSSATWETLNNKRFDNRCVTIPPSGSLTYDLKIRGKEEYCYKLDFGKYDRTSGLKDLRGNVCPEVEGCRGDYSTFDTLGREVSDAVTKVLARLGDDTEVTLVGHSRGGLAASAYLGGDYPYKGNVKAFLSTGTPFLGSPLGKINGYLKEKCLPYSQTVNVGTCKEDWNARKFIRDFPHPLEGLDVIVPSVGFLMNGSSALNAIFTFNRIQAMQVGSRFYHNLVYSGIQLGDLYRLGVINYNPFPNVGSVASGLTRPYPGGTTFAKEFSVAAETYILGNGISTSDTVTSITGDGIVPEGNQDISKIIAKSNRRVPIPGTMLDRGDGTYSPPNMEYANITFHTENRKLTKYKTNTVHIEEPKQLGDLSSALDNILDMQMRKQVPTLRAAPIRGSGMVSGAILYQF